MIVKIRCVLLFVVFTENALSTTVSKEEITSTQKTSMETTQQNGKNINVWMDSVMFQHTLRWEGEDRERNYTVLQKHHWNTEWESIPSCAFITATQCDLTDELHTFLTYDIRVKAEESTQTWWSNIITFCAESNTKLLPPRYKLSRMNDVIFIRPITDEYEKNLDDLDAYKYEVKYWPKQEREEINFMNFKGHNTKAGIKNLNPDWPYCFSARFYEPTYIKKNLTSGSSDWGEEVCVNATSIDIHALSTGDVAKWVIASASIILLLLACFGCKLCRTYKKIKKHDEKLPEYLDALKTEMKDSNCDVGSSSSSLISERIDRIDIENSYVKLDPSSTIHQAIVDEDWLYPLQDETELDMIQRHGFGVSGDDATNSHSTPPSPRRFSRSRSRSRGYHSFSSDDVTSDDVLDLAHETYVDIEYANTNTLLESRRPNTGNNSSLNHPLPIRESDRTHSASSSTRSDYLNMNGLGRVSRDPTKSRPAKRSEDARQLHPGVPYENFTYCSQLYGNIPDAFVCPDAQLRASTEL